LIEYVNARESLLHMLVWRLLLAVSRGWNGRQWNAL